MRNNHKKIGYGIIIAFIVFVILRCRIDMLGTNHSRLDTIVLNTTDSPLGFLLILAICAIPIYLIQLISKKQK